MQYFLEQNWFFSNPNGILYVWVYVCVCICMCVCMCVYMHLQVYFPCLIFWCMAIHLFYHFLSFHLFLQEKNLHVLCSRKYSKMTPKDSLLNIFSLFWAKYDIILYGTEGSEVYLLNTIFLTFLSVNTLLWVESSSHILHYTYYY